MSRLALKPGRGCCIGLARREVTAHFLITLLTRNRVPLAAAAQMVVQLEADGQGLADHDSVVKRYVDGDLINVA